MKAKLYLFLSLSIMLSLHSFAQSAGDYRSAASGDWNTAATWQTFDGSAWVAASNFPVSTDGYIIIVGGHTVTVPSAAMITADQVMVQENAQIMVAASATLELVNGTGTDLDIAQAVSGTVPGKVKVSGILKANEDVEMATAANSLIVEDGGTFHHHYATKSGNIPLAAWNTGSTLLISGYTSNESSPGNLNQDFHHIIWNTPDLNNTQGFINLGGALKTVNGNFTVNSTGTGFLSLSSDNTADILNIAQNFRIENSSVVQVNSAVQVHNIMALFGSTLENTQGLNLADGATFLLEGTSEFKGISPAAQGRYSVHYKDISTPVTIGMEFPDPETGLANLKIENSTLQVSKPLTVHGDLILELSGTLKLSSTNLFLKGNFINHGSFQGSTNKVIFNGQAPQTIRGSATTTLYDLEINNTATPGLVANGHLNIENSLILGEGVSFDPDGGELSTDGGINVTLLSTALDQAAYLAPLPATSQVAGKLVLQHFIPPVKMYRYLTTATKDLTLGQWTDDFIIYGSYAGGPGGNASLYVYDEPQGKFLEYPGPSGSLESPIEVGKGYTAYMYNGTTPTIIDTRGPVQSGNYSYPLSYTESSATPGQSSLGNPYPSAIDWASPHWQRVNVSPSIRIYKRVSGKDVYSILNAITGIGLNAENTHIASGQGFFTDVLGPGAILAATEGVKVSAGVKPSIKDVIVITLSNSTFKDQTALAFREGTTANYEAEFDSPKIKNTSINLYSLSPDGKGVAQNIQDWFSCTLSFPFVIDLAPAGVYQLSFSHLESLSQGVNIFLQDNYLNTSTPVSAETVYSFDISSDPLTYGPDRFKLFLSYAVPEITSVTYEGSCSEEIPVTVNGTVAGKNYQLFMGTTAITDPVAATSGVTSFSVSKTSLTEGNNTISIKGYHTGCDPVTMATELQLDYSVNYTISSTEGTSSCTTASVTLSATASSERALYKWYESTDAVTAVHEGATGSFTTPVLEQSTTYYVAAVNAYGCESARTAVEAVFHNLDKPVIQLSDGILKSNYETGNQWFLNGAPIANGTENSITPKESGTYGLEVTENDCKLVADVLVFTITGINDKDIEDDFYFYPSPSQRTFQVKGALMEKSSKITYVIYQHNGTIVQQGSITDSQKEINIENLSAGLYLVKIKAGENVQYGKLMKK